MFYSFSQIIPALFQKNTEFVIQPSVSVKSIDANPTMTDIHSWKTIYVIGYHNVECQLS